MKNYFEFKDDKSSKFWEIELSGNSIKTRYGKVGSDGQISEKVFDNLESAQKEFDKLVKEKTKKGYIEITKDNENKSDSTSHSTVANIPQELKGMSAEEIFSYSQSSFPDKNKKKTFEYTEIAAKLGSVNAMHTLGYLYQEGTGTKLNYTKAVECFENASKAGNIASYYSISICYLYGNGVERSDAKSHEYMLKAAELGYTRAMACIGTDYRFGQSGLPKDYAAAARWYQKGAELGDDSCMEHLGYLYAHLEMPANLLEQTKKTTNEEVLAALCEEAFQYYDSEKLPKNHSKAFELMQKAAENGYPKALNALGIFYNDGVGVNIDMQKAYGYFLSAYRAGYQNALKNIEAVIKENPEEIFSDSEQIKKTIAESYTQARYWLEKAFLLGNKGAENQLNFVQREVGDSYVLPKKKKQKAVAVNPDLEGSVIVSIAKLKTLNPKAYEMIKDWDNKSTIYYFDKDKTLEEDLELDIYHTDEAMGFVFGSNLTVKGDIVQMEGDFGPHLIVTGNLKAKNIDKGGSYIHIGGDCLVDDLIYGYYNHGVLKVDGKANAKYIINDDHCFELNEIEPHNPQQVTEIDMYGLNLSKLFIPNVIKDEYSIDTNEIRRLLAEGQEILLEDFKMIGNDEDDEEEVEEEVEEENEESGLLANNPTSKNKTAYFYKDDSKPYQLVSETEITPLLKKNSVRLGMVYDYFLLYETDVTIAGDLNTCIPAINDSAVYPNICVVVLGNLTVNGRVTIEDRSALVVTGNLKAQSFYSGESEVVIKGTLNVEEAEIGVESGGLYKISTLIAKKLVLDGKAISAKKGIPIFSGYEEEETVQDELNEPERQESGLNIELCEYDGMSEELFLGMDVQSNTLLAVGGQGGALVAYSTDGKNFIEINMEGSGLRSACLSQKEWWVAGEYGFIAKSTDNGDSWITVKSHTRGCIFGIIEDSEGALWVAGDNGYVACSKDHEKFEIVKGIKEFIGRISYSSLGVLVPTDNPGYLYIIGKEGVKKTSLASGPDMMAAMVTSKGSIISVGLKGGIFRSEDKGESFTKIKVVTNRMFTCIGQMPDGLIVAFGENGLMAASLDDGQTFMPMAQDVCTETIWCCKNYGKALLLGAENSKIFRLALGDDTEPPKEEVVIKNSDSVPHSLAPNSDFLDKLIALYFKEKKKPDDFSKYGEIHESAELKKWYSLCGHYDLSKKELDNTLYGDYSFDEILSIAIEETDGKLVAGFRSIFCAVQTIAEGEEDAVFASRAATPDGTSIVYTTHQDEFEDFRYGTAANSIASWFYSVLGTKTKLGKKHPELFNSQTESMCSAYDSQKIKLPSYLDPAVLSKRVDWLVHIFLSIADSNDIMDSFSSAGTIKDYEAEKEHIATWSHLSAYWLLSHLLLENKDALQETIELSKLHHHGSVIELIDISNQFLTEGRVNQQWWNEGCINGFTETIHTEAPPKFFTKASYAAVKKKVKLLNKLPEDVTLVQSQLKAEAKADKNIAKTIEILEILDKSSTMDYGEFEKQYSVTPYKYAETLANFIDPRWEIVIRSQVESSLKYNEKHTKSGNGLLTVYSLFFKSFKSFNDEVNRFNGQNIKYVRTDELIHIANRFGEDKDALDYLYSLAEKWIDSLDDYSSSLGKDAFELILEKNTERTHRLIAKFLESKNGRREIFINVKVVIKAREFGVKTAIAGLFKGVEEEMGDTNNGDRGRVIYALAELAGMDAYPPLKALFDKKVHDYKQNITSEYFFYINICFILRGILHLNAKDPDVVSITNSVFDYYQKMDTMRELPAVCGLIWGIRCGKRTEFIPKINDLLKKGRFKSDDKEWVLKFLNESIAELNQN